MKSWFLIGRTAWENLSQVSPIFLTRIRANYGTDLRRIVSILGMR